jgi:hypothetical protein
MKKVDISRRTFWWTVLILILSVSLMDFTIWLGLSKVGDLLAPLVTMSSGPPEIKTALIKFQSLEHNFFIFCMPASFVLFLILLGLIRLTYRAGLRPVTGKVAEAKARKPEGPDSEAAKAEQKIRDQRMFLHLISVLQREGRLIDFFAEDLKDYDDAQIGAAVREIHGTCRSVVEKSLSLKPVIEKLEGETVTVQSDFDPNAIKLVGNVTGEPPFTGTLRHRGWHAGKLEIPTFSGSKDPGILAPAEIEIQ